MGLLGLAGKSQARPEPQFVARQAPNIPRRPDDNATGASITVHGKFPHARYFNASLYKFERNTFVSVGDESLDGWDIEPNPGSNNPYRVGADRLANNRDFTLQHSGGGCAKK
jgi:hypothetical protein